MNHQALSPLSRMQNSIQLAGFHYIACLKSTPTNADHQITIEKRTFSFPGIERTESRLLHIEFQRWAANCVLRDLLESFSIFLMEVYRGAILRNTGAASVTVEQFERKGLEDQLNVLARDFGIAPEWISRLVGYNRARNCLAHRQGIVGPRDATDGADLIVRWIAPTAEIEMSATSPLTECVGPMSALLRGQHIYGEAVRLEIHDKSKRICIGSTIDFDPGEILEICLTLQSAASAFAAIVKD